MNMFFSVPKQVKFLDPTLNEWLGGIGYRDEVICGCCGGIFRVEDILENDSNGIVKLPWVDISDEIRGDE